MNEERIQQTIMDLGCAMERLKEALEEPKSNAIAMGFKGSAPFNLAP